MADTSIPCPVDGCDYKAIYRVTGGESETYLGWMKDEHPDHPAASRMPRNVKPKTLRTEMLLEEDGELNF